MRFALTSDLHGHLPPIPPCDVLLVAGDVCPIQNHNLDFQSDWLRTTFVPWLRGVPARQRIFIAGNHDLIFAERPSFRYEIDWPGIYLQDSGILWDNVQFWGSPWATELSGWPFCLPDYMLADYWQRIPDETQVLLVHGPPWGLGDTVIGNLSGDKLHVGSRRLADLLLGLPDLRLVVCGHIHEGAGEYKLVTDVPVINAALMDVHYIPANPVRVIDLDI